MPNDFYKAALRYNELDEYTKSLMVYTSRLIRELEAFELEFNETIPVINSTFGWKLFTANWIRRGGWIPLVFILLKLCGVEF